MLKMNHKLNFIILCAAISLNINAQLKSLKSQDFVIQYEECAEEYVTAGVKVLELVKRNALELGFELPRKIHFKVLKADRNRLYFDKKNPNSIIWEFASMNDFLAPEKSGFNNIYGLCHEMGHVCMFNITPHKNNWMTRDYREGWADYFGNMMIDSVHKTMGLDFWPDQHNYLEYAGMEYFKKRIESDTTRQNERFNYSSQFWYKLSNHIGLENVSSFFKSIKSGKVRNPDCERKFIAVLKPYDLDMDFISDFENNIDILLITDRE